MFVFAADAQSKFEKVIRERLSAEVGRMNFIWGDGYKFTHPLHPLGKARSDLPVLAIDSFRHMFDFGKFTDIDAPRVLEVRLGSLSFCLSVSV